MIYNLIPNTDLTVSTIALGTWVFSGDSWGKINEQECMDVVSAAFDQGINLIDTAPIYGQGRAETIIGKAIKNIRDKIILATKCGLVWKQGRIVNDLTSPSIKNEIEASLKRLRTEYIDLYQCHWPDPHTPIEQTLDALNQLKKQGKIRHIGVSNFDSELLNRALKFTPISTLQGPYSLLDRTLEQGSLSLCQKEGIGVFTYGSLGGGILSGKYNSPPHFPKSDARSFLYPFYKGEEFKKAQETIRIMKEFGKPLNQIALNWVRQQKGITSVFVGCRTVEQVGQNAGSVAWDLTEDQLIQLSPCPVKT